MSDFSATGVLVALGVCLHAHNDSQKRVSGAATQRHQTEASDHCWLKP